MSTSEQDAGAPAGTASEGAPGAGGRSEVTVAGGPAVTISPDGTTLPIGTQMHEFIVEHVLGEGGFGVVYLARDTQLQRTIAIKEYMPSSLAVRRRDLRITVRADRHRDTFDMGLRSFLNEARLLASFDHPSLLKVYRFWEANGTAYMAMPYYQGPTLKHWLQQHGPLEEDWLQRLIAPLFDALEVIHRGHTYHRDIAPDNIVLLGPDRPVLLDFGAARRVIGDATQDLTVILKPGYAPIEQYAEMATLKQGPWTDVYALCAVLYACVTGAAPPPAVARVMHDEMKPARQAAAGRYSEAFLAAIDAGLAVKPDQRPRDMASLRRLVFGAAAPESAAAEPAQDTRPGALAPMPGVGTLPGAAAGTVSGPAARPVTGPAPADTIGQPAQATGLGTPPSTAGGPDPAGPASGFNTGALPLDTSEPPRPPARPPAQPPTAAPPAWAHEATPHATHASDPPASEEATVVARAAGSPWPRAEPSFPPPQPELGADTAAPSAAPYFEAVAATRAEPALETWAQVGEVRAEPESLVPPPARPPARRRLALGVGAAAVVLAGLAWWQMGEVSTGTGTEQLAASPVAPAPALPSPSVVDAAPPPQAAPETPQPVDPTASAAAAALPPQDAGPVPAATAPEVPASAPPLLQPSAPATAGPRPPFSVAVVLDDILRAADPAIVVEVKTDQPRLVIGRDRFRFSVTSSIKGHVYVYLAGTDPSQFNLLFPNAIDRDNRIEAGRPLNLPRKGWNITAGGPPGTDRLVVLVAPHPRDYSAPGLLRISAEPIPTFDLKLAPQLWEQAPPGVNPYAGQAVCTDMQTCDLRYGAQALELIEVKR